MPSSVPQSFILSPATSKHPLSIITSPAVDNPQHKTYARLPSHPVIPGPLLRWTNERTSRVEGCCSSCGRHKSVRSTVWHYKGRTSGANGWNRYSQRVIIFAKKTNKYFKMFNKLKCVKIIVIPILILIIPFPLEIINARISSSVCTLLFGCVWVFVRILSTWNISNKH